MEVQKHSGLTLSTSLRASTAAERADYKEDKDISGCGGALVSLRKLVTAYLWESHAL